MNRLLGRFRSDLPHVLSAVRYESYFEAGNKAYLVDDPTRPVQLRPRLASEPNPGNPEPDNALLVRYKRGQLVSMHYVKVSSDRLANTPENVEFALADLERWEPGRAAQLRHAIRQAEANAARRAKIGDAQHAARKAARQARARDRRH